MTEWRRYDVLDDLYEMLPRLVWFKWKVGVVGDLIDVAYLRGRHDELKERLNNGKA